MPSVDSKNISVGSIVRAKFKNREVFGVVHEIVKSPSISIEKLKPIVGIHENNLKLDESYIKLISWVSKYYHYPIGQTYNHFLPKYIEKLKVGQIWILYLNNWIQLVLFFYSKKTRTSNFFVQISRNTTHHQTAKSPSTLNIIIMESKYYYYYFFAASIDRSITT